MPQTEVTNSTEAPDIGKSVEVLSVAAVTTAAAAAALMNPAARKEETVAVVDERALVDAMYEKLLPRMKVELSLWLQDALELQAKNMLSGVMQQLKEDYDMLFGETLKESLRQAILALGREQQGKAARRSRIDGTSAFTHCHPYRG
jgi:cytochrome c-type biogenesis protein CcmH/NrfG